MTVHGVSKSRTRLTQTFFFRNLILYWSIVDLHCCVRFRSTARAFYVLLAAKNPPANAGDAGSIPGLARSLGEGNGNPLQYSCLENPMDRGAWRAIVHQVSKNRTQLSD